MKGTEKKNLPNHSFHSLLVVFLKDSFLGQQARRTDADIGSVQNSYHLKRDSIEKWFYEKAEIAGGWLMELH